MAKASRPRARRQRRRRRQASLILDRRQLDLLGLALVALGVFLAFVLYGRWDGGRVGRGLVDGLAWGIGAVRYLAPVLLGAAGAMVLLGEGRGLGLARRVGAAFVFASAELALAAHTLGIGPAGTRRGFWHADYFKPRGGIIGESLYWASSRLVSSLGAHVLAVFLFLGGALLISRASPGALLRRLGMGVGEGARMLTTTTHDLRMRVEDERRRWREDVLGGIGEGRTAAHADLAPPDPPPGELIVRATHVEAPPIDAGHGLFERAREALGSAARDPLADARGEAQAQDSSAAGVAPGVETAAGAQAPGADGEAPAGRRGEQLEIPREALTPAGRLRGVVTEDPAMQWRLPDPTRILQRSSPEQARPDTAGQERLATSLVQALDDFGVRATVIGTVTGPHITRFELRLAPGTKMSKVAALKDDLAYALAATDIRILAPIPGKQAVGVEVPNAKRRIVRLGDVFQAPPTEWSPLTVWLGKDVAGKAIGADLARMPHLLVAGTTGAGKSGAINAMLASILLRATPHEVRLVLVDPKQVELNHYESIPHLLTPVITSPRMAANALGNLVREMEQRYGIMSLARTRSLAELNQARARRGEPPLPYILCVIDELADLMMVAPADVEDAIIRLAQKARAVGIHLLLATQSPRVDVITGMIKANVPSRIAFAVSSQTDSRVILDQNGAESLLGQGDMLFSPVGSPRLQRIQGAYIDEPQIAALTDMWRRQGEPEMREELLDELESEDADAPAPDELDPDEDPLLEEAIALVAEMGTASTSMLQRRLRLGYTRAGRLIDMLERRGVISGYEGSKPRQVLIGQGDVPRVLAALGERSSSSRGGAERDSVSAAPPAEDAGLAAATAGPSTIESEAG